MNTEHKIKCDAKNCVYHSGMDSCNADCIQVGNCEACNCGETACNTFELNENALG